MRASKNPIINRILSFVLVILLQSLYLPLNRTLSGGVLSHIRLDDFVPVFPVWTIPYVLWLPVCMILGFYATLKMPEDLFKAYFSASVFTISVSMLFFTIFPTYVQRPAVMGGDIFSGMLRTLYHNDRLYNAFPSGHVYLAVLTALFFICWRSSQNNSLRSIRWDSWNTWIWVGLVIVVCLSTIFTGQHSIIDIPGGMLVAVAGYFFGRWWANRSHGVGVDESSNGS